MQGSIAANAVIIGCPDSTAPTNYYTGTIGRLRRRRLRYLTEQATVSRVALVDDGAGGRREQLIPVHLCIRCSKLLLNRDEAEKFAGDLMLLEDRIPWRFNFPYGTEIENQHRITQDGVTYEVIHPGGNGTWATSRRVIALEMTVR